MSLLSKTLVVDKDPALLGTTQAILESAGYETLQASNGDEALAVAREYRPDLLLLNVNLDRLGAIEVRRRKKPDPSLSRIYVILLSKNHADTDSPAAPGILGYSPEVWIGQDGFSLFHPYDLPKSQ